MPAYDLRANIKPDAQSLESIGRIFHSIEFGKDIGLMVLLYAIAKIPVLDV
jgi:hypothetical protein